MSGLLDRRDAKVMLQISTCEERRFLVSGVVLGVAFSGFFDGILLHQILQWHHLISLVPGPRYQDPRVQIAADGLFHALMYGLAVLGLALLWTRDRRRSGDLALWRSVALGFGAWNIVDVALFHWILRWHHIRLDTSAPIAWDVAWLVLFGVLPAAVALIPPRQGSGDRHRGRTGVFLALMTFGAAIWASGMPKGQATIVLFRPGTTSAQAMAAIASADGRLVSTDPTGQLAVVALPPGETGWGFYRQGALLVSSAAPTGCAAWTTASRERRNLL
jgi:uncharacterized membrane protein